MEETPKDWEKSLEGVELTGDWAQDLLAVARSQLGYRESERNFILNEDGTYVRVENTSIIHVSGVVVTYWTYTAWGTYTVDEEDEEVKVVTLAAPEDVIYVMNDAVTTVEDDDSLLEYFEEETIEINLETLKFAYAE